MKKSNSFRIYPASAGSGKTFTLVKEYLKLLLASTRSDNFKHILAITFTNKAVAEMKERIVLSLHALSEADKHDRGTGLLNMLSEELDLPPGEICIRSEKTLRNVLSHYSAFEVSTIDGFTHRVLRTFARDLELPVNFEVELSTDEVLAEAVDRVIDKAGSHDGLTRVLINFVLSKADEDKSWDISRDLHQIAGLLLKEESKPYLDSLRSSNLEDFKKFSEKLLADKKELEEATVGVADQFFRLLEENNIEPADFSRGSCPGFFQKIWKGDFGVKLDNNWQKNIGQGKLYTSRTASAKKLVMDAINPKIEEMFLAVKRNILDIQFLNAVKRNLVPLSLLSSIQKEIELIKKENATVLISDFNETIGKAVRDQPAPFIYERLGDVYRHYFIDEFQDTSQMQWENLIPLVDQTLSIEHLEDEHGSLTLVGDAKQSIYRWRGGKAEQFMALCNDENPFSLGTKDVLVLPNNYRSARNIVHFNNEFFKFSADVLEHGAHRELFKESHQAPISEDGGYVNISFIEAENAQEEMQEYPERVLSIIRSLEEEGIEKKDVCILTRKRKESVAVANHLSDHGIPVISAESLLLERSPKVRFINNVLRYVLDTTDRSLKYDILYFLLENKIDPALTYGFINDRLSLEGQAFLGSLKELGITLDLAELTARSVYEVVEYIIRSSELVSGSDAYLQFYLDFVYEASQSSGSGIFDFLELWDRKKEKLSIVIPKGEDAVQIMTIHTAKGLEFPVVIYPFANSRIQDVGRDSFWLRLPEEIATGISVAHLQVSDKMKEWRGPVSEMYREQCHNSQLDALNVLYVALTRPVQRLYIISKMDLSSKGEPKMQRFSGLFISYLQQIGKWTGELEYHFGEKLGYIQAEKEVVDSVRQKAFYSSPIEANGMSIVTRAGMLWDSSQELAIEKGRLIHGLFARIHTTDDVEGVLLKAREEGILMEQDEAHIKGTITEVVNHPELSEYFSVEAESRKEQDIISGTGVVLRPDRINFQGNSVTVIDYKTGEDHLSHLQQVAEYAEVLERMGYLVKKKLLVYLNKGVSVKIV